TFDKLSPSLKVTADSSGTSKLIHTFWSRPDFMELRIRFGSLGQTEIDLGDGGDSIRMGIETTSTGAILAYDTSPSSGYVASCYYPNNVLATYTTNQWYRFTFEVDQKSATKTWRWYINGLDLTCGTPLEMTSITLTTFRFLVATASSMSVWIDDLKLYYADCGASCPGYGALNIGFSGLQPRQSIRLLAEDGSVIDQTMQTVAGTTLLLSFNSAPTGAYNYYENGDNAKAVIQIYAEDGTPEYQSPLTRFFVGETYTYTRPRAFADELVKTRSGAL